MVNYIEDAINAKYVLCWSFFVHLKKTKNWKTFIKNLFDDGFH
jgi:hypothetical protein